MRPGLGCTLDLLRERQRSPNQLSSKPARSPRFRIGTPLSISVATLFLLESTDISHWHPRFRHRCGLHKPRELSFMISGNGRSPNCDSISSPDRRTATGVRPSQLLPKPWRWFPWGRLKQEIIEILPSSSAWSSRSVRVFLPNGSLLR